MKTFAVILFALTSFSGLSQKQFNIKVYRYFYDEFAFNPEIKKTLSPTLFDYGCYESPWYGQFENGDPTICTRPRSLGFEFETKTHKKFDLGFGANFYKGGSYALGNEGVSSRNHHWLFSASGLYPFKELQKGHIVFSILARTSVRIGKDEYWRQYLLDFEQSGSPFRRLRDVSISTGAKVEYYLPLNILLSAELGLTQWVFLYSNITDGTNYNVKPWHQFDVRLSAGYTFGQFWKKNK